MKKQVGNLTIKVQNTILGCETNVEIILKDTTDSTLLSHTEQFYMIALESKVCHITEDHPLYCQVFCNGSCLISNIQAKWPGSVCDL